MFACGLTDPYKIHSNYHFWSLDFDLKINDPQKVHE